MTKASGDARGQLLEKWAGAPGALEVGVMRAGAPGWEWGCGV